MVRAAGAAGFFMPCEVRKIKKIHAEEVPSATLLRKRLFALSLASIFLFLAVFARFFYVQIVEGENLRAKALGQWTREVPVIAARGEIVDTNGVVLAENDATYSVFVRPNAVEDKSATAKVLSQIFDLDESALYEKMTGSRVSEITAVRHAEKAKTAQLEEYDLPGVYYARDNTRVYPYGSLLSRVLGFTSSDGAGLTGLEKYYDKYLTGIDGEISYPADLVGKEIEGEAVYYPATDGMNIRLTIDYGIQSIAESAMREVVGRKKMDSVLFESKQEIAEDVKKIMQEMLDRYRTGIEVMSVAIQNAQPPQPVQAAFDDAVKAGQDRERQINEGQAYANDVIPKARGMAARLAQEAEGYKARVVETAKGDADRFTQVLAQYEKAPRVTRDRMYVDMMQQVMQSSTKVYVDTQDGNNLLYLPFDKLMEQNAASAKFSNTQTQPAAAASQTTAATQAAQPSVNTNANRTYSARDAIRDRLR